MPTVISCPNCRTKLGIPSQATPQARDSNSSWAWLFAVLGSAFVAGAGGFAGGWLIGWTTAMRKGGAERAVHHGSDFLEGHVAKES